MIAERSEIPGDEEHAENESGVADAVDDESFVSGVAGGFAVEIETDQQIRAQAHAFPADEHEHIIVRQDERQHGEHEEVEVSEEAVVAAFMRHVSGGVNVDQHADAGDEEQPDAGERVEQKSGIGLERSLSAVVSDVIEMAGVGAEPGVENFFVGLVMVLAEPSVVYCRTAPQDMRNASTTEPTQTALTVGFCSLRPKKNMSAAPMAGKSGMR